VNTTGLPDPPPVAVSVADPPTVPVAGAVKLITWDAGLMVMVNAAEPLAVGAAAGALLGAEGDLA
jgi:hypothetical protein